MVFPRILPLLLAAVLFPSAAFAQVLQQPSPASLLAERAFAVPVEPERLTLGRATAVAGGKVAIHTAVGAEAFHLGGITLPTGRVCLHPDNGRQVDCVELAQQTLAALLADRDVGCLSAGRERGECYLAYDGAWYSVNRLLVRSGMVKALAPHYIEAERRSRAEGAGLWDPLVYPAGDGWREGHANRPVRTGNQPKF